MPSKWMNASRDERAAELERRRSRSAYLEGPHADSLRLAKAAIRDGVAKLRSGNILSALMFLNRARRAVERLPEPTVENTWHPNSHRMIEVRDWFFGKCRLGDERISLFRMAANFVIVLYDYDPPYRHMIDEAKARLDAAGWTPCGEEDLIRHDWGWWDYGYPVKAEGESCDCGGRIEISYRLRMRPKARRGRCKECGTVYTVRPWRGDANQVSQAMLSR